jgi:hypothetical protein
MSQGRLGITSQAARAVAKQPEMTMKKHWLDKPILRDLFWFIVLPYRMKMFLAEQKERTEAKDEN